MCCRMLEGPLQPGMSPTAPRPSTHPSSQHRPHCAPQQSAPTSNKNRLCRTHLKQGLHHSRHYSQLLRRRARKICDRRRLRPGAHAVRAARERKVAHTPLAARRRRAAQAARAGCCVRVGRGRSCWGRVPVRGRSCVPRGRRVPEPLHRVRLAGACLACVVCKRVPPGRA